MEYILGLLGLLGGLITCCADMLLDLKGKDNRKLGKYGFMDSAWAHMDVRRFSWSIVLALIGAPLIFLGMIAMAGQLIRANPTYGKVFWIFSMIGCTSGGFIHPFICFLPIVYKAMEKKHGFDGAEEVINALYKSVQIPFWVVYLILTAVPSFMLIWALFAGYLNLSPWYILLTFPTLLLTGRLLDQWKHDWFYDLPHIVMPSLSLGLIGLMAFLNQL